MHFHGDEINQTEELVDSLLIVLEIDRSRVYCIVPNDTNAVKRLLNLHRETRGDKIRNICVDVLSRPPQMGTQLLNAESQQCGRPAW